jgi:hypothetical protein
MKSQSNKELTDSVIKIINTIAPDRFDIIGVKDDENGLRIYLEPKDVSPEFFEADMLVYDLIWHIEQSTKH